MASNSSSKGTIQHPPKRLVATWVWMLSQKDDPMLQRQGREKLIAAFGSLEAASRFVEDQSS